MKALTIYKAYKRCEQEKRWCSSVREWGIDGIAVNRDKYALRWQRYDRLANKLDKRLLAILMAYDDMQKGKR